MNRRGPACRANEIGIGIDKKFKDVFRSKRTYDDHECQ